MVKGRQGEAAVVDHPVEGKHYDGVVSLDDVGMDLLKSGRVGEVVEEISELDLKAGKVLAGSVEGGDFARTHLKKQWVLVGQW
ncbi:hypothetical protein ACLOJK_041130 [Asimina triloba]